MEQDSGPFGPLKEVAESPIPKSVLRSAEAARSAPLEALRRAAHAPTLERAKEICREAERVASEHALHPQGCLCTVCLNGEAPTSAIPHPRACACSACLAAIAAQETCWTERCTQERGHMGRCGSARISSHPGRETRPALIAAALIEAPDGTVLLARRIDKVRPELHDRWEVPGGHVEPGEDPGVAVVREVHEELGIWVEPQGLLGLFPVDSLDTTGDRRYYVIALYHVRASGQVPGSRPTLTLDAKSHSAAEWFMPGSAARDLALIPSAEVGLRMWLDALARRSTTVGRWGSR